MQAYQIDTLATRLGVKRIAKGATACLNGKITKDPNARVPPPISLKELKRYITDKHAN